MTDPSRASPETKTAPATPAVASMPALASETLFAGRKEVVIRHDGHDYRLRITRQNKLILTK